jgi:hypothetical protein
MIKNRERWTIFDSWAFSSDGAIDIAFKIQNPTNFTEPFEALGATVAKILVQARSSELTGSRLNVVVPKTSTTLKHSFQISKSVADVNQERFRRLMALEGKGDDVTEIYERTLIKMPGQTYMAHGPQKSLSYAIGGYYMVGFDKYLDFVVTSNVGESSVQAEITQALGLNARNYENVKIYQRTEGNMDTLYVASDNLMARGMFLTGNRDRASKAKKLLDMILERKEKDQLEFLFELDHALHREIGSEVGGCDSVEITKDGDIHAISYRSTDPKDMGTPLRLAKDVTFPFPDIFLLPFDTARKDSKIKFYLVKLDAGSFYLVEHAQGYTISALTR